MEQNFEKENRDNPREEVAQELHEKEKPESLPEGKAKQVGKWGQAVYYQKVG